MDARQRSRVTDSTVLQPPGQAHPNAEPVRSRGYWLWIVLAGLLLLGVAVIFVLPAIVSPPYEATVTPQGVVEQTTPMPVDTAAVRTAAQQTLQTYLQLRARLELENAASWGADRMQAAAAEATSGDRQFAQRQFAAAGERYQTALELLQALDASRADILGMALKEATRALAKQDIDTYRVSSTSPMLSTRARCWSTSPARSLASISRLHKTLR